MAFLFAVSSFQFRSQNDFELDYGPDYSQIPLPPGGDVTTTANIGQRKGTRGGVPRQRFDIFKSTPPGAAVMSSRMDAELETLRAEIIALRRSAEAMRRLNEQLSVRVNQLETRAPAQPSPPSAGLGNIPTNRSARQQTSNETKAADSAPRSNFGVDLGRYSSLDDVESAWAALNVTEGAIIGTLEPLASVYQNNGGLSAHLLAGPFPNAAEAAEICARLSARRITCKPTLYVGQKLTKR